MTRKAAACRSIFVAALVLCSKECGEAKKPLFRRFQLVSPLPAPASPPPQSHDGCTDSWKFVEHARSVLVPSREESVTVLTVSSGLRCALGSDAAGANHTARDSSSPSGALGRLSNETGASQLCRYDSLLAAQVRGRAPLSTPL